MRDLSQKELKEFESNLKRLGENVRRFRNSAQLTQEDVADRGFNLRFYQKLESGSINVSLGFLFRVAVVLDVTLDDLLEGISKG